MICSKHDTSSLSPRECHVCAWEGQQRQTHAFQVVFAPHRIELTSGFIVPAPVVVRALPELWWGWPWAQPGG
jgi:hypothetical protein